ncbi:MAG: FkbM family methyltransferase [Colwellia sp.]|nr:FkbM family methyltransferase [Colwellia sp.]
MSTISDHIFKIKVDQGEYSMYLPKANVDYIQKHIAETGQPYELDMLQDMASRLSPGDVVLDIGANVGNHTLYLAALAKVKVYAFEPNALLVKAIRKSAALSLVEKNVIIYSIGLGSEESSGHFKELISENIGAQSIEVGEGKLRIQPLDSIRFSESISMMKVDVEGMELEVLRGAIATIQHHQPIMYVEALNIDEFFLVEDFLAKLGYIVLDTFNASPTHLFIHIDKLDNNILEKYNAKKIIASSYVLPQELKESKEHLHQANLKYRNINEQVIQLKKQLANKNIANDIDLSKELVSKLTSLQNSAENKEQQLAVALSEISSLSDKGNESYDVVKSLLDGREELVSKLTSLQNSAENKEQQLAVALSEISSLSDKGNESYDVVKSLLDGREELVSKLTSLQNSVENKEQQLTTALVNMAILVKQAKEQKNSNDKTQRIMLQYLDLIGKNKKTELFFIEFNNRDKELKGKVADMAVSKKELEVNVQNLQIELNEIKENLIIAKQKESKAELAKIKALKQIEDLRASVMFQLGYVLVNACLSFKGFISLPLKLMSILKLGIITFFADRKSLRKKNKQAAKILLEKPTSVLHAEAPKKLEAFNLAEGLLKNSRSKLKVACIMDEFTYGSYEPTCNLQQLTPDNWLEELELFQPELLFIESAWRGKDELWGSKVGHNSAELQSIITWCKTKIIPTLFWNKEDPVHYQTFLTVAKQFDHVFTTDLDCVSRYKAALKHNNVYFLPFACQPQVHNPIEKFERKDAISFAGAYYVKYPDRTKDLESLVSSLPKIKALEIFDRNFGKSDPNYMFPPQYTPYIVGTLPFDKIDIAYKGYKYAINLNSIKQSQTMFARRVYELLASNTLTISNYSKGIRLMFGDLVACSDSGEALSQTLAEWGENSNNVDKLRLAGLRKVLQEHTYLARLNYIEEKIFDKKNTDNNVSVAVVCFVKTTEQAKTIISQFNNQTWQAKQLVLVVKKSTANFDSFETKNIKFCKYRECSSKTLSELFENNNYLATFNYDDFYGENYLTDLMLNFSYLHVDVVGKASCYNYNKSKSVNLVDNGESYTVVNTLTPVKSVIYIESFSELMLKQWYKKLTTRFDDKYVQFSVDRFNYCQNGMANISLISDIVGDIKNINPGASLTDLQSIAENVAPMIHNAVETILEYKLLKPIFEKAKASKIKLTFENYHIHLSSTLDNGKHEYIYGSKPLGINLFNPDIKDGEQKIQLFIEGTPGLSVSFVLIYLDQQQQRLCHDIILTNQNKILTLPNAVAYVKVGFRVLSAGSCEIKAIVLGQRNLLPSKIIPCSETLLITNHYPSYQDLYKNGFVHTRVKAYKAENEIVDIFRFWKDTNLTYHEFDGVDVATGGADVLRRKLSDGNYSSVLVHFLDQNMWDVLKELPQDIRINVWVHGAEIHPWYRRKFNIETQEQEEIAKTNSELRMAFWHSVLDHMPKNLKLIFVSKAFSQEVFEDLGYKLPKEQYKIIHNPIDTDTFKYIEKPESQRKKILSIRPFATKQYANDLSVAAILKLSKTPIFESLEFRIIGDGKLFDETLEPLRKFSNVIIERKFVTHAEIAALHQEYGLFLCPSRWDSQGVSRDEAMSSGLIPITTAVAAIPEFADDTCAILAPPEDAKALAEGILKLIEEPGLFSKMSQCASEVVKATRDKKFIANEEINTFITDNCIPVYSTVNVFETLSKKLTLPGISESDRFDIYKSMSGILYELKRYEEAYICIDICLQIEPDNMVLKEMLTKLKSSIGNGGEGILDEHKNFLRRKDKYLDYPEVVQIETLAACNAGCSFCPYPTMERQGEKMSMELFDKIIADLKRQIPKDHSFSIGLNHINEPLADSRWATFVSKIASELPNANISIITNGYLLHEKNINRLLASSNVSSIQVSLNEIDEVLHEEKMNMNGKFERIVTNLDMLHTIIENSDSTMPVFIRRVGDYTQKDEEFITYCSKRWPEFNAASRGVKDFLGQVNLDNLESNVAKNLKNANIPVVGCSQWYHLVISASGKVATCCFDGKVNWPIGDTNQSNVLDIYNSQAYLKLRGSAKTRLEGNSPCSSCSIHWGAGEKNAVYNYKP